MDFSHIILIFIVAVVLVYVVFWVYRYYKDRNVVYRQSEVLIDGQHDATKSVIVDNRKIPLSAQGNEYTISFWIFIKDYNYRYGNTKTILYRGDKDNKESNPFIYLHPTNNDMTIKVQLQTDGTTSINTNLNNNMNSNINNESNKEEFRTVLPMGYFRQNNIMEDKYSNISGNKIENFEDSNEIMGNVTPAAPESESNPEPLCGLDDRLDKIELQLQKIIGMKDNSSTSSDTKQGQIDVQTDNLPLMYDTCVVKDIPLQKWTHIAVSIFNNHIEVYLDGKLNKACSLKGFPKPSVQNMYVTANGGFNGYLANLEYSNMSITQQEVYSDYLDGPKLTKGLGDKIEDVFNGVTSVFTN